MTFCDFLVSLVTVVVVSHYPVLCASFYDCIIPVFVATLVTHAVLDTIVEGVAVCFKPAEQEEEEESEDEYEEEEDEDEEYDGSNEEDDDSSDLEDEGTITFRDAAHPVTGLVMKGETLTIVCRGDVRFKIESAEDKEEEDEEEEQVDETFCVLQQE